MQTAASKTMLQLTDAASRFTDALFKPNTDHVREHPGCGMEENCI